MLKILNKLQIKSAKGFILLDVQLSVIIGVLLATLTLTVLSQSTQGWNRLARHWYLLEQARTAQNILGYTCGRLGHNIVIQRQWNGEKILYCNTEHGAHSVSFSVKNGVLYKHTLTRHGTGINPVTSGDCQLNAWQITKINGQKLLISFQLSYEGESLLSERLYFCSGGVKEV